MATVILVIVFRQAGRQAGRQEKTRGIERG